MTEEQELKQRINAFVNDQMGENDVMNIKDIEVKNYDDFFMTAMEIFIYGVEEDMIYEIDFNSLEKNEKYTLSFFDEKSNKEYSFTTLNFQIIRKRS